MLFKILHGDKARISTDITPYHEGYCYVTYDGDFYVDMNNKRVKLNAQDAETLTGASLATILNSSEVEIPTSKAVLDALSNYYTKSQIDNYELITTSDIDAICGTTIQDTTASEVTF